MDATATRPARTTAAPAAKSQPPAAPGFDAERAAAEMAILQERVDKLGVSIVDIDVNANGAFDRIASMAKLTLHYMKSPDKARHVEVVADALEQIWWTAEQAQLTQESEVRDAGFEPNNDTRNLEYLRALARPAA